MNKVYRFILGILAIVVILFIGQIKLNAGVDRSGSKDIYVYNWGDYMDPAVIKDFEKETGYRVIYETFDSNEAMIAKVEQGQTSYDLTFPSDYTVELMRDKGLLKKIDYKKIKGMENIDPRLLDHPYDPKNEYSIPYFWGTFGIAYNSKKYKASDFDSWAKLWDSKYKGKILSYDGARETLAIGLLKRRESINTKDKKILLETKNDLVAYMANVKALLADEIRMYMALEEADIGVTFSGEASIAEEMNKDISYVIPKEGTNLWFDTVVIPKTSKNTEGAYALINYLLRPEVAAKNANYVSYATPNTKALEFVSPELRANKTLYPDDKDLENLEVFTNLGKEMTILYNDYFLDLKISPQAD